MLDKIFEIGEQAYTEEDRAWDNFVAHHPHGSILQTTNWARLKNRFNWSSRRVWLRQDDKLVAGAQILFRSYALGLMKIAYIPHGPLVDWRNDDQVSVLFNQIDHAIYQHGAGMVKIEPLVWQDGLSPDEWEAICQRHDLLAHTDTIQPPRTVLLDISPTEDEILAAMKQKTRYNIRLSARKGVTVREGTLADIPLFTQMMQVTGSRDGFGIHQPIYYKAVFELFGQERDQAALLIAEYEQRPLAAVMVFTNGKTGAYFYGASTNEERNRMPAYAVQWAAIQWAKQRGCTTYDLWGIPDADEDELEANFKERSDGLWGVYRFKRGFGGQITRTVGSADRVYNQRLYKLYQWRRNR